ncbi:MAG: hypothetical protein AB1403_09485 [Candidatus Riflebacteria bacterium]
MLKDLLIEIKKMMMAFLDFLAGHRSGLKIACRSVFVWHNAIQRLNDQKTNEYVQLKISSENQT